jgi:hypothetical protein
MKLLIFTFLLLPLTASAQLLTFGVRGGVPAQTPLGRTDNTPFVLGPSVNVRLFSGFSLDTGVLYHRLGRGFDNFAFIYPENTVTLGFETWRGSALEVPILAKYRFRSERAGWRPFLSAGPTVRRTSITTNWTNSVISGSPLGNNSGSVLNMKTTHWNVDPATGVGVDFRTRRFHIEPEARYSYWGAGKDGRVRKNQVNFLLGFRF